MNHQLHYWHWGFCGYFANVIGASKKWPPLPPPACHFRWVPGIVQWQSGNRSGFRWVVPDVTTTATQAPKNDSGRHFPSNMKGIFGSQRSCWVIFLMYKFLRDNFSCVLRGGFRNACIKSFKLDSANLNDKGKYHQASLITNCSPLKINVFFDEISLF